jgi:hypothetical protein
MRAVTMIVKQADLGPGDHADILLADNKAALLNNIAIINVVPNDSRMIVTLTVTPEQAEQISKASSEHPLQLKRTRAN